MDWSYAGAWLLIWVTCIVAGVVLGQLLGSFRPFRRNRELPAKARERWSGHLAGVGFFLPILYWWAMAVAWGWEQIR